MKIAHGWRVQHAQHQLRIDLHVAIEKRLGDTRLKNLKPWAATITGQDFRREPPVAGSIQIIAGHAAVVKTLWSVASRRFVQDEFLLVESTVSGGREQNLDLSTIQDNPNPNRAIDRVRCGSARKDIASLEFGKERSNR
jgi:hypothetical protein